MTPHTALVTVNPDENLAQVKEIFDTHKFHHIPVVHFRDIVGIISKTDDAKEAQLAFKEKRAHIFTGH